MTITREELQHAAEFAGVELKLGPCGWLFELTRDGRVPYRPWKPHKNKEQAFSLLCRAEQAIATRNSRDWEHIKMFWDALASGNEQEIMTATVKLAAAIQRSKQQCP